AIRFTLEMKAEGHARPGLPGSAGGGSESKPLALRVETRLVAVDRVVRSDAQGRPSRALRRVLQAASAINGDVRPTAATLRPEVSLLVEELSDAGSRVFSLGGPLTRQELELVEVPADPLVLGWLLPEGQVAVGSHWKVPESAARALTSYETVAANSLLATLEGLDDAKARIKLSGEVRGAVLGAQGTITCSGVLTFDRAAGLIERLELTRTERRQAGEVEAGLDLKSTLTLERAKAPAPMPAELADSVVQGLPAEFPAERDELLFTAPSGKYALRHDRSWHIYADDTRQTVLKRLERGASIAQCNLALGPVAGKGRHQDLEQFRDDIKRALGARFGRIVEAGALEGADDGVFRYRVAVEGHEGEVGLVWYYYLVASADGEQLLAAFTLGQARAREFADQDVRLIGTLEWKTAARPAEAPGQAPGSGPTD
ncbi:MAG TPA: hypothetical protein VGY53_07180, partial [Isosphaeraceae bacterium]|nr:hypothetical protein [Isosphaeraceae bacterium]